MTDRQFVSAFEQCTLPESSFHHRDHIRLVWLYLHEEASLLQAIDRFAEGLKRYAEHLGKSGLYHETITWASMLLIHDRMQRGRAASFDEFEKANEDLFIWPSMLERYYDPRTLASPLARATFLLPDRP